MTLSLTRTTPLRYHALYFRPCSTHIAVIVACTQLALASHAFAEHQHLQLNEVHVTESLIAGTSTQPSINEARIEINKTAGGVTVVDMETVREGRTSNFNDTLGLATGVFAQSRFGAEETRLSIRGSGLQRTFHGRGIKLMQDGIAVNLADGSFDFPSIDPMASDYVTVYRGANALQYGASNLGGAINFVSRTGYTAPQFEVRAEAGEYGYFRLGFATGGVVGDLDYYLSASTYGQSGFRDNAQQSADRLTGNVGYQINDHIATRFYFGHVNSDSELPSNLSKAQLRDNPQQSTINPAQGVLQRDINVSRVANKTTFVFNDSTLELGGFYAKKNLFHPIFQLIEQDTDDYGLSVRLRHQSDWFGMNHEWITGVSPTYGRNDSRQSVNRQGQPGALLAQLDLTAVNYEAFAESRLSFTPEWTVITGLQYAHSRRKADDKLIQNGIDRSVNASYKQISPKFGVLYAPQPHIQLFANLSRSFEPPSFGELNFAVANRLRAQSGTTFEIGSRGNSVSVDWDIALYYAKLKNELLSIGTPTTAVTVQNADKTIHAGLELGLTARLPFKLEWRQSLLTNHFKFDNDALLGNARLAGIPRTLLRGELMYRNNGFYAGPTIEWSPQRYNVDFAETLYADPYTLLGAKIGQKVNANWAWFLEGRNLSNKKYAATTAVINRANPSLSDTAFLPGDGRTVYAGVTYTY